MSCLLKQFGIIFLSLSLSHENIHKRLEDFSYIHLIVLSPQYVPKQQNWKVCSAILLVEDLFYITAKECFDEVLHNRNVKIAIIRRERPSFEVLVYEDFTMRSKDLQSFVVLQKNGIELVVEKSTTKELRSPFSKNPYEIDNLDYPRVLLTHADHPSFTHCFCLGWGTFNKVYQNLSEMNLEFSSYEVHSTRRKPDREILVEWGDGDKNVEDYGSPLLCEMRHGDVVEVSAVVGVFTGGDSKVDLLDYGLVTYRSFSDTLEPLTRWAIGTNVSVGLNLKEWTLWPINPEHVGYPPANEKKRASSSGDVLTVYKFIPEICSVLYSIVFLFSHCY